MEQSIRQKKITRTAIVGITVNLLLAAAKMGIGLAVSSIAIISEGTNNAADAASSFLTLIGAKLSVRHPDKKHPFGYGRIEYLTNLIVSMLIIYTGMNLLRDSAAGILHPAGMSVTVFAVILVAVSAVVKFFLGIYTIRVGKNTESVALTAVGTEGRNDSLFSILTILSSVLFLTVQLSADAFVGLVFSVIVLKNGISTFWETVSELIGRPGKQELARQLYKDIRSATGIINAVDLMLHNYGPNSYAGSVNIEIDHKKNIGDIYEFLHELQLHIMHEYHVMMVFGIYAVNGDYKETGKMRSYVSKFVRGREHVVSYHALYYSRKTERIYCDLVVDYELKDWEGLEREFVAYMKKAYPGVEIELTVETDFV